MKKVDGENEYRFYIDFELYMVSLFLEFEIDLVSWLLVSIVLENIGLDTWMQVLTYKAIDWIKIDWIVRSDMIDFSMNYFIKIGFNLEARSYHAHDFHPCLRRPWNILEAPCRSLQTTFRTSDRPMPKPPATQ